MLDTHYFNMHDLVQLMTAGLALMLAVTLALSPRRRQSDSAFAAFIFIQGCISLYFVLLYNMYLGPKTHAVLAPVEYIPLFVLNLLQGPVLLLYVYSMAGRQPQWRTLDFVLIAGISALNVMTYVLTGTYETVPFSHYLFPGCALVASAVFGIRAIKILGEYQSEIRQQFSNIDDISLRWLSYSTFGFVGIWVLRLLGVGVISAYLAFALVGTIVVLRLSHRTENQDPEDHEVHKTAERDQKASSEKVLQLVELMQRVKVYQDLNLGLDDLADSMGVSPRSLSRLINGHFGKNFYDFVNHYRVLDARRQLEDGQLADKSIQRVFEDAGFNSKSTFNTLFKKATGCTPTAYRRKHMWHHISMHSDAEATGII